MKNLFQFLAEAGASQASAQAAKLNLKSDGHGSWLDSRGNIVATTEKGRLVFLDKKKKKAEEGPVQQMAKRRADDNLAGAPLQQKASPKKAKPEEVEGGTYPTHVMCDYKKLKHPEERPETGGAYYQV